MTQSYFIAKLYRQHTSVVMVLPRPVQTALNLKVGNHVVLQWKNPQGTFELKKFVPVGAKEGDDNEKNDLSEQTKSEHHGADHCWPQE